MKLVFDLEGTLTNPAHDHAKQILEHLVGNKVLYKDRKTYVEAVFGDDGFDAWDDELYFITFNPSYPSEYSHSTGTSPWIANLAAAVVGIDTREMVRYQVRTVKLNPGVDKLLRFITYEKGMEPYIVTNAYPAAALKIAMEYDIPWEKVKTQGLQIEHEISGIDVEEIADECEARVPMDLFVANRSEVHTVLDNWIEIAEKMLPSAKIRDVESVKKLMPEYVSVFKGVANKELRNMLEKMFLPPSEQAIMGGYNKTRVVERVAKPVAFGDSIVDGMMLSRANREGIGVSINCTNSHAVSSSKMNVCVSDYELLIPMIDDMICNTFDVNKAKQYRTDGLKIFTRKETEEAIEKGWNDSEVKAANNASKSELKKMFKLPNYVSRCPDFRLI